ncbi:MAG: NADH-quinone oxidoreductase subunit J [Deltaproteobacteria bacterium]|nr:NADH-quinone oxidoreductase subunit J [Deltaproteobacteria bacterium]
MSLQPAIFYFLAAFILVSTGLAITRRNLVHVVVFLIFSFLGSAMLFFLLGAPFLAALEVIIYAGAIMILFLFVIMMLRVDLAEKTGLSLRRWLPSIVIGFPFLALSALAVFREPGSAEILKSATVGPGGFGRFVFERYWLAVEIISILLLLALLAAVLVGRGGNQKASPTESEAGEES